MIGTDVVPTFVEYRKGAASMDRSQESRMTNKRTILRFFVALFTRLHRLVKRVTAPGSGPFLAGC